MHLPCNVKSRISLCEIQQCNQLQYLLLLCILKCFKASIRFLKKEEEDYTFLENSYSLTLHCTYTAPTPTPRNEG